jgi:uncharacterized protein (TIGR00730 family)
MKVCVFCSSSDEVEVGMRDMGRTLGRWIGSQGHELVWGGCNVGLMNVLGLAVQESGGRTHAIVPRFMQEKDLVFGGADRVEIVTDMRERKHRMRQEADAFVALPGGVGTWEEFFEVLALKKLGRLQAPLVLLNHSDYYAALLQQIQDSIARRCSPGDLLDHFHVADTADQAVELLADQRATTPDVEPHG